MIPPGFYPFQIQKAVSVLRRPRGHRLAVECWEASCPVAGTPGRASQCFLSSAFYRSSTWPHSLPQNGDHWPSTSRSSTLPDALHLGPSSWLRHNFIPGLRTSPPSSVPQHLSLLSRLHPVARSDGWWQGAVAGLRDIFLFLRHLISSKHRRLHVH